MPEDEIERAASILQQAYGSGTLSKKSTRALLATGAAAEQIGSGLGETSGARDLILATVLVDDSLSIAGDLAAIRAGHSKLLEAMSPEQTAARVQVLTRALNRGIISPFRNLREATPLTDRNFGGHNLSPLGTPLYLQSLLTLGTVIAKAHEERARGAAVRTFTLIITDGQDNRSGEISARDVRAVVTDMLEFSSDHIVAGMGVGEPDGVDFRAVFRSMGIPKGWIFTSGSSPEDLAAVFRRVAKALALAASSRSAFLELASGPPDDT